MSHDTELLAARFVAGLMGDDDRRVFETHLLECEQCWDEVEAARRGRGLLEGLRAAAPVDLRDRVRAVIDLDPEQQRQHAADAGHLGVPDSPVRPHTRGHLHTRSHPERPQPLRRLLVAAAVLAVLAAGLGLGSLLTTGAPVEEAVAAYLHPSAWSSSSAVPPAEHLQGLRWVGARSGQIDGAQVVAHTYLGSDGQRVMVVRSNTMFRAPTEARPVPRGDWQVEVNGITVFCTQQPNPSLVVGDDPATVMRTAAALSRAERAL